MQQEKSQRFRSLRVHTVDILYGEAAEDSFLTGFRFHQNRPKKDFKDPSQISTKRK